MTLEELSREYRAGGEALRQRVNQLERQLSDPGLTETRRLELRRRICVLSTMARDTIATARYLSSYYEKEENR